LLLDERGALRPLVNVYVDGEDVRERDGLETRLQGSEEIRVIAAIAGGAEMTPATMRNLLSARRLVGGDSN
jgi:hypothetical protein